jgi:outer membrane receptor protein involved in Fe transport
MISGAQEKGRHVALRRPLIFLTYAFFCTLWLSDGRCAQDPTGGRVVDAEGRSISGVLVTLVSATGEVLAETTTTDAGSFRFPETSMSEASRIRFVRAGYAMTTVPVASELEIRMIRVVVDERVAVTALRRERPLFDTPQSVSIVTDSDITDRIATSAADALERVTGVQVQRTDLGGGSPYLRGLVGNQILILVDGIRLNNSTFRLGPNQYLNTVDPFGVERIEVIRGPASSLYGSDGLGGVVNVLTGSPAPEPSGQFKVGFDTASDAPLLAARLTEGSDRLRLSAGLSAVDYDELEAGSGTGVQSPTGYERRAADLKASIDLGSHGSLTMAAQYFQAEDVPRFDRIDAGKDLDFRFDPQRRILGYVRYKREFDGARTPSLSGTLSWMEQTEGRNILRSDASTERRERDEAATFGLGLQLTWPERKRLEWIAGLDLYRDDVASKRTEFDLTSGERQVQRGRFPDGATYSSSAVFAQTTVHAGPRLDFFLGSRYSFFDADAYLDDLQFRYETEFDDLTGSANFLLKLTPHVRISGGVNEGFRAPSLDDATVFGEFNAGVEVPNTDLSPEHILNYELSLKTLGSRFWTSVTLFDAHLRDLIVRAPGSFEGSATYQGQDVFQRQNIDRAEIYGGEVEMHLKPRDRVAISLSAATIRGTNETTGDPLRRIPPTSGHFSLRWLFLRRGAWIEVASDFADEQDRLSPGDVADTRIPDGGTPGYATVHVGAGLRTPKGWQAGLVLHNLGNIDYRVHGSGVDGPGRSARLFVQRSIRWRDS